MTALIDTNVLVYHYDPRFPEKQSQATALLRQGLIEQTIALPHQAILEFVAATTRTTGAQQFQILPMEMALREAEELLRIYPVVYPNEQVVTHAIRGKVTYQMSWFDAHLWAYAETYGFDTLYSEDFESNRYYGAVKVVNPFH